MSDTLSILLLLLEIPGAPTQVIQVSSTSDSVVVNLVLSHVGTRPLTHVEAEFHSLFKEKRRRVNISLALVNAGDTIQITLSDLQDNTIYVVSFAVYNYGGRGFLSQQIEVATTGKHLAT